MVPPFLLTALKLALLALLYLFVYRAVRTIAADLAGAGDRSKRRARRRRGGPVRVLVLDERGARLGSHRLEGALRIGRDPACEIPLSDTYASQQHARISERGGTWIVEDLGSTNGTYLNERKVAVPAALAPGDRIRIGKTFLEVRA